MYHVVCGVRRDDAKVLAHIWVRRLQDALRLLEEYNNIALDGMRMRMHIICVGGGANDV